MKVFSSEYLNELTAKAQGNPRKRQHQNLHQTYDAPCQRLFNAIEPGSYIRPHRHTTDPKDELLIAVRGSMGVVIFDDQGMATEVVYFGARRNGEVFAAGVELSAGTWHTVVALETGCILLEVKG